MNRHQSTIGREMKRHRGQRGYRPKQAHEFSPARRRAGENGPRMAAETGAIVDAQLAETWRPEAISGHLSVNEQPTVSHEAIDPRIDVDQRAGGPLPCALRCQKARRKRYGGRERRGSIPNQGGGSLICAPSSALARNKRSSPSMNARPAIH